MLGVVEMGFEYDCVYGCFGEYVLVYCDIIIVVNLDWIESFVLVLDIYVVDYYVWGLFVDVWCLVSEFSQVNDVVLYENDLFDIFEEKCLFQVCRFKLWNSVVEFGLRFCVNC